MTQADLLITRERSAEELVSQYLPPHEILESYFEPSLFDIEARIRSQQFRPGAEFALTTYQGKFIMIPPWHPLFRQTPEIHHGGDYGSGIFEGLSLYPVTENGAVISGNLILFEPRMKRLERSLRGRLMNDKVDLEKYKQAIIDLASVNATTALIDKNGTPSRAYVRPSVRPGDGPLGVSVKQGHIISPDAILFNWANYLDSEKSLQEGITAILYPTSQRLSPITGKYASNYGEAGVIGAKARSFGAEEALYLGPYIINAAGEKQYVNGQMGQSAIDLLLQYGVLADGPGEEIFAISNEGVLLYPPMDVNRLGGTTLNYLVQHLAPRLGIECKEQAFTLNDIRTGKVINLLFAGNAVTVMPMGKLIIHDTATSDTPQEIIALPVQEISQTLALEYQNEVSGSIPPSNESLVTPINMQMGNEMNHLLKKTYAKWFE